MQTTMDIQYHNQWSDSLQRNIEYKTYGTQGRGVLVFPSQDQRFYEWEDNGMIDVLAPMIEAGRIHLICCDSIDAETWSNGVNGAESVSDYEKSRYQERIDLHERWFNYIIDELIPELNQGEQLIVTGCSMGGYHAANVFFRRPDLFCTLLSLSGLFHASYFFPAYDNDLIYRNSPLDYLRGISDPSLLLDSLRRKQIICCVGQGAYEEITSESNRQLQRILTDASVDAWFDYWGADVNHDFVWWRRQASYFFDKILNGGIAIAA